MTPSRLVFAALLALAAAPAFSEPLTPIPMGPAASGQCVVGADGCGLARGASMDPVAEGALVGLGQRAVPSINAPAPEKKTGTAVAKAPEEESLESRTDLAGIGGQIINPNGGTALAPVKGIGSLSGPMVGRGAGPATFDAHQDGSVSGTGTTQRLSGLSYVHSQKVESTLSVRGTALGGLAGDAEAPNGDPKLAPGDSSFAPGGVRAGSNGR